jgi:hypothetical protein
LDEQGICYSSSRSTAAPRPAPYAFGGPGTSDLHAEPGTVYFGWSAQPFINEVAVRQTSAGQTGENDDCAIELYNPYNIALSLKGYRLWLREDLQLDLDNYFVPARGYLVLVKRVDQLAKKVSGGEFVRAFHPGLSLAGCKNIYLMREYIPRGANYLQYAAIDAYDCTGLESLPPEADGSTGDYFVRRSNHDANPADADDIPHWCAAAPDRKAAETVRHDLPEGREHMTLGRGNPTDSDLALRIHDRFADYGAAQRSVLYNINEFNHIMRIAHVTAPRTGMPVNQGLIPAQLRDFLVTPQKEVEQTQFPGEASVHFDFRAPPWVFGSTENSGPGEPAGAAGHPYAGGDVRALKLLESITMLGPLRVAGQINVNTAPGPVLSTIPILNENPNWVAAIMAYRWRTTSLDERIPPYYRSGLYDFTDCTGPNAKYPGYGIRSLGELEVPLSIPFPKAPSLDQRDALWSDVYNLCTVRSDTFNVYGYLEAVRQNPRYTGEFDNSKIWYQGAGAVTDDANSSMPLLRVARRRWVAIVDRSQNSASRVRMDGLGLEEGFGLPKVVAARDMER